MKHLAKLLCALLCALLFLTACGPAEQGGTTAPTQGTTENPSASTGTENPTEPPVQEGVNAYEDPTNLLCGIDQFGRVFMPVSRTDEKKDVGMFYFLWHGGSEGGTGQTTYNVTELLKTNPDALWDTSGPAESPNTLYHYWGEPLFGYYMSKDKWVIRRHMEMLINAGVDFLVFDTTNGFTYSSTCRQLFKIMDEFREEGMNVPKITFYTNSYSIQTMQNLYNTIYKRGQFSELWYCPNGKPMIIGITDPERDKAEIGDVNYNPVLSNEMKEFFDIRESQWPNKAFRKDGFPWMEWTYPQPIHDNGVVNVSVAQHPQLPFSNSIKDSSLNWGRGYNFETKKNESDKAEQGQNFQYQWNSVIERKDDINTVFVTGWNEWIAQKLIIGGDVWFVDCATEEFSRDIEPMKGGYEDAFYLQLIDNVRRFKGQNEKLAPSLSKTIDINDLSAWNDVTNVYKSVSQSVIARTEKSVDQKYDYALEAARNNIQTIKVTHDSENVYFLIECENDIVGEGANWMNIFLGVGELRLEGWEGYQFVVNRNNGKLSKLDAEGNATDVADVMMKQAGKQLAVSIPMSALGTSADGQGIYFKVADGMLDLTDIMDTYINGKSVPMGRLSYYYYF